VNSLLIKLLITLRTFLYKLPASGSTNHLTALAGIEYKKTKKLSLLPKALCSQFSRPFSLTLQAQFRGDLMPISTNTVSRRGLIKGMVFSSVLSFCLGAQVSQLGHAQDGFLSDRKFTREETMLLNMTHAKGSVGYLLLESKRCASESTRNMEKALFQLREIEKSYAKSKGQPDTRYLSGTELKMVQAKQRSEELEGYTSDCFQELKASIKSTLLENTLPKK
jgi:hypothetical protein